MSNNINFTDLNQQQHQAVHHTDGPLLVLSAAGTGKTKVLTSRIANILAENLAYPFQILAITFTNKAALEMKERIFSFIGNNAENVWIGTFHAIGLKILRNNYQQANLQKNFSIIDQNDSEKLIKKILSDHNIDTKINNPSAILSTVSLLKDKYITPNSTTQDPLMNLIVGSLNIKKIYQLYQEQLKKLNLIDFGDILMLCLAMFQQHSDILFYWQNKFKYILVDEYQDTSSIQYEFIKQLALIHRNICVVGDDDQSIYAWRGADIYNMQRLEQDFPELNIIKLEQNYRSNSTILQAASSIINNNDERFNKTLWCDKHVDYKVTIKETIDNFDEANYVAQTIKKLAMQGYSYGKIAILFRASYLTRIIENKLIENQIPYKVLSGISFYNRKEIKDIIAYLKLIHKPYDDLAFLRIINTPKRGIGATTQRKIEDYATTCNLSLFNALKELVQKSSFSGKVNKQLCYFVDTIEQNHQLIHEMSPQQLTEQILEQSQYYCTITQDIQQEYSTFLNKINSLFDNISSQQELSKQLPILEDELVIANNATNINLYKTQIEKLLNLSKKYQKDHQLSQSINFQLNYIINEIIHILNPNSNFNKYYEILDNIKELVNIIASYNNIEQFLDQVVLLTDINQSNNSLVSLITIHSAKGLEFDTVFLPSWNEGIIPSQRALEENYTKGMQEERRLAYVAITRAKEYLYISYNNTPSPFLYEIDDKIVNWQKNNYNSRNHTTYNQQSYYKKPSYKPLNNHHQEADTHTSNTPQRPNIKVGNTVEHPKFGQGIVRSINGIVATVEFNLQLHNILLSYLTLVP